jgi:hypothetical protein
LASLFSRYTVSGPIVCMYSEHTVYGEVLTGLAATNPLPGHPALVTYAIDLFEDDAFPSALDAKATWSKEVPASGLNELQLNHLACQVVDSLAALAENCVEAMPFYEEFSL